MQNEKADSIPSCSQLSIFGASSLGCIESCNRFSYWRMIRMDKTSLLLNIFFNGIIAFLQLCRGHPSAWDSLFSMKICLSCENYLVWWTSWNYKQWKNPKKVLGEEKTYNGCDDFLRTYNNRNKSYDYLYTLASLKVLV